MNMPPVYCIYCRELAPRRKIAEQHFKAMGINADFFEGVHGKTFKLKPSEKCTVDGPNDGWHISQGHKGLCLSHWALWSHIWHAGHEDVIILEDDAFFGPTFHDQFKKAMNNLPKEYNLCYLGWLHGHQRNRTQVRGNIYTIDGCPFGTHAMYLKRSAIRVMLDTMRSCNAHIDVAIALHALPHLKWCVTYPSLVTQRSQQGNRGKDAIWRPSV